MPPGVIGPSFQPEAIGSTARKEVTDVSWFSREVGDPRHGALSLSFDFAIEAS